MQCNKRDSINGGFNGVNNQKAPRFSGCFIRVNPAGIPSYPWLYCRQCVMSDPRSGRCDRGSAIETCQNCDRRCGAPGLMLCPEKLRDGIRVRIGVI